MPTSSIFSHTIYVGIHWTPKKAGQKPPQILPPTTIMHFADLAKSRFIISMPSLFFKNNTIFFNKTAQVIATPLSKRPRLTIVFIMIFIIMSKFNEKYDPWPLCGNRSICLSCNLFYWQTSRLFWHSGTRIERFFVFMEDFAAFFWVGEMSPLALGAAKGTVI